MAVGLFVLLLLPGCSSVRKPSRFEVRNIETMAAEEANQSVQTPLTKLRRDALDLEQVNGCPQRVIQLVNELALDQLPREGCPAKFSEHINAAADAGVLGSSDRAMLEALRNVGCQGRGLLSSFEQGQSLADGVREILNRWGGGDESTRTIAGETGQVAHAPLYSDLQRINSMNLPLQRHIAMHGTYVLSEDHLDFIMGLIRNRCRLKSVERYYARDNASLTAMEQVENLIADPRLKQQFVELRESLQGVIDNHIRSFF